MIVPMKWLNKNGIWTLLNCLFTKSMYVGSSAIFDRSRGHLPSHTLTPNDLTLIIKRCVIRYWLLKWPNTSTPTPESNSELSLSVHLIFFFSNFMSPSTSIIITTDTYPILSLPTTHSFLLFLQTVCCSLCH